MDLHLPPKPFSHWGKRMRNQDWFESHRSVMDPVIATKRKALPDYNKDNPSAKTLTALRTEIGALRRKQQSAVPTATAWQVLCQNIQTCAENDNIQSMYEEIRTAFGPNINKTAYHMSHSPSVSSRSVFWHQPFSGSLSRLCCH